MRCSYYATTMSFLFIQKFAKGVVLKKGILNQKIASNKGERKDNV